MKRILQFILLVLLPLTTAHAQFVTANNGDRMSPDGSISRGGNSKGGAARDTTGYKQAPRGIKVWTVDEVTGACYDAEPDTTSYLRMNHVFASGVHGEYNTLGNNGSPRLNRIFIDRSEPTDFPFLNGYSQVLSSPGNFHFTNTFSPITNLDYNECGTQLTGEDHLKATFAVNVNKQLGFGFKFDYLYSRGYYQNQNLSHFLTTLWGSYHGDRYEAHLLFSTNHQKQNENGGIVDDNYILHPELSSQPFAENEIPTVLSDNWNIHDNQHIFFTQRYNVGFNRRVPMTEQEKEAKKFALQAEKEKAEREAQMKNGEEPASNSRKKGKGNDSKPAPAGRPDNAKVIDNEPPKPEEDLSGRISMTAEEANDSAEVDKKKEEEDLFMKNEYVPVTSFFHTAKVDFFRRNYRSFYTPEGYYANDYYELKSDSINDRISHTYMRNNIGISLLEGFNKWAKAGINLFAGHEYRYYALPTADGHNDVTHENSMLIGAEIVKHQGKTLHFDARGEYYLLGTDFGQVLIDGNADLNFPLLGDTVRLDAHGFFHLINPDTYFCKYSSRHFQWDEELSKQSHLHIEGNLSYPRTKTRLRFAVDNLTKYTYLGTSYTLDKELNRLGTTITPRQCDDVQVITAQLYQDLSYGILHWDNVLTFQKTTNDVVLPLPKLNVYTNLYLRFKIAKVLHTDFGADCRFFTSYSAPEYSPAMQQFVIQENEEIRTNIGKYPVVNVYANFQLKTCRFYLMMSHVNCNGKGNYFYTPHHPLNGRVLRFGLNWNFYN